MKALIVAVIACGAFASAAGAQVWESDGCTSVAAAPYVVCALSLEGDRLMRGRPAGVVTMAEPFAAIRLTRYVRGDSALELARRYERVSTVAQRTKFVGGVTMFVSSIIMTAHRGQRPGSAVTTGFVGGVSLFAASFPLQWLAERSGERAVWWHNSTLAR